MGEGWLSEALGLFLAPLTALMAIENLFLDKSARSRLAGYVFGFEDAKTKDFELDATKAAIRPFLKTTGQLSFLRIAMLCPISFVITLQLLALFLFVAGNATQVQIINPLDIFGGITSSAQAAIFFGVALLFTTPFDYFSIWITKKLFVDRRLGDRNFFLLFLIDVVTSSIPVLLLFLIAYQAPFGAIIESFENKDLGLLLALGFGLFTMASFSLFVATLLQLAIIVVGVLLRVGFRALQLNRPIALTPASDTPLTFIGFVLGLVLALLSLF